MMKRAMVAALALMSVAGVVQTAEAQSWAAWHGCWRGVAADAGQFVCVLPGADALTARMVTVSDGAIDSETVVRADNVDRPVTDGGCTGTEKAFFSRDHRRVFTHAELDCSGTRRVSTGVIALVTEAEWLDAQAVTVGDQHGARSVRYRAVNRADVPASIASQLPADQRLAQEAARIHATAPLDLASVVEASQVLAPPAVEALLAARNHGFDLDARRLALLKEQGVPVSIIDVMIALSYPQRFAVREQRTVNEDRTGRVAVRGVDAYMECFDPFGSARRYGRFDSCYNGYNYNYSRYNRYGYSPWGYDPYGWNYNSPIVVIVDPRAEQQSSGSVTRRGYTRGEGSSTSTAQPRPAGSSNPAAVTTGTSSSGSTQSTGSTSTGRVAKPRTGGGGGG